MKYNTICMYDTYAYDIYMISSIIQNFLYNNKVSKFPLVFCKRNV